MEDIKEKDLETCLNREKAVDLADQVGSNDASVKRSVLITKMLEFNKKGCYDCDGKDESCSNYSV